MSVLTTYDGTTLSPGLYEVIDNVQNPAPNPASSTFFFYPVIPKGTQLIASQLIGHPWETQAAGMFILTHSYWPQISISETNSPTKGSDTLWDKLVPYLKRIADLAFVPLVPLGRP